MKKGKHFSGSANGWKALISGGWESFAPASGAALRYDDIKVSASWAAQS